MGDPTAPPVSELAAATLKDSVPPSAKSLMDSFTDRVLVRTILSRPGGGADLAGLRVPICGLVQTGRVQGKGAFAFLEVNDGSCAADLQVMVEATVADLSTLVPTGTCVHVVGMLKVPPKLGAKQKVELHVEEVLHVGALADPAKYPLPNTNHPKKKPTPEYLRDWTHLRPRIKEFAAVIRIRDELGEATRKFFREEHGFVHVDTGIITTSDCEGAGKMFQVTTLLRKDEKQEKELPLAASPAPAKIDYSKDFFGQAAYLSVSGQLHLETLACAGHKVFTVGPTFRAEQSHTSRHLAEFRMVEAEIPNADLEQDMKCAEAYVKYMCQWLLDKCHDDMQLMAEHDKGCIARLKLVASTPFIRLSYTEAVQLLEDAVKHGKKKFEKKVEWGIDLASEHERYLTEVIFQKPVIVYNYPKGIKAFYMRLNDDSKTVAAMDVLVPKVGELIGGSQREERYEVLQQRMLEMGLPLEPYEKYLDLRRYGTMKHAGFGLGFERMVLFSTGIDNIRDVIPFPRYPGRADL
ncbi:hypothetical protein Tsubulata_008777 [Turnera subulata]|uniref:asparagine--tRNA ligase n=1 Tax=Turnera subulata TaxID=218843 RepID=A0A9Q0GAN1_9ROSI|nr:hypothetical protein Tsubulata_008777 [Turnera subulata]